MSIIKKIRWWLESKRRGKQIDSSKAYVNFPRPLFLWLMVSNDDCSSIAPVVLQGKAALDFIMEGLSSYKTGFSYIFKTDYDFIDTKYFFDIQRVFAESLIKHISKEEVFSANEGQKLKEFLPGE